MTFMRKIWICKEVLEDKLIWLDLSDKFVSRGVFLIIMNHLKPIILKVILRRPSFWSIGANIGWFTLLASKMVGKSGKVISFEPRNKTFSYLKKSIRENDLCSQVTTFNCALADEEGIMDICWAKETDNPGGTHIMPTSNENLETQK